MKRDSPNPRQLSELAVTNQMPGSEILLIHLKFGDTSSKQLQLYDATLSLTAMVLSPITKTASAGANLLLVVFLRKAK